MFRIATDPRASTGLADIMDRWTVTDVCNMHDALDFRSNPPPLIDIVYSSRTCSEILSALAECSASKTSTMYS